MKNKKKSALRILAPALAVYLVLTGLLVAAERNGAGTQIDSLPRAFWYSLATLTTVGYGDLTPVTPVGRLIGGIFMLMSTGLLALLIGVIYAALTGRLYPRFKLWLHRRDRWYILTLDNDAARALAARLDGGLTLFLGATPPSGSGILALDMTPDALAALPFFGRGERLLFAMDADDAVNERLAATLNGYPLQIFCRSDAPNEDLPDNVVTFNDGDCAARLYWQSQPWDPAGERAALIGGGRFARALLMQALLTAPPNCVVELFGDWTDWQSLHGAFAACPDLQIELRFHPEDWRACADILRAADRVVLCDDDVEANRAALCDIRRYCALSGALHARCPQGLQKAWYFGEADRLFTPEMVMKQTLNARARRLHELYRAGADYPVPEWEALSDFLKRSNLAAADHLLTKLRLLLPDEDVRAFTPDACRRAIRRYEAAGPEFRERCRRIEHSRWCLFHALYNWTYDPVRDNALRRHPMMVPYERLDETERRKDDNAWLLIGQLAETSDDD